MSSRNPSNMREQPPFTLQQVDLARADFAAILDELDFVKGQLARLPTRKDLARIALVTMIATAGLVLLGIELLSR
jgi:hypothetical protein